MADAFMIQLAGGHEIELRALRQWQVYEGLLMGLPTAEWNKDLIAHWVKEERDKTGEEPYLVRPVETPVPYAGPEPYFGGTPSALPSIACVGRFTSSKPVREEAPLYYSTLTVIWFQDRFALPIDPRVLEDIRAIDWAKYAVDQEF
jgi:hypothetical protein